MFWCREGRIKVKQRITVQPPYRAMRLRSGGTHYFIWQTSLLKASAKSWKATTRFTTSVYRLSAWNNSATTGQIFIKCYIWGLLFGKSVEKIQVSLKPDKNSGYITWRPMYIYGSIFRWILIRMRDVSDKGCRGSQKTKFYVQQLFFSENPAVYEIMWKKYGRAGQVTGDNMAHAHCVQYTYGYKHTHTHTHSHTICNVYLFSTAATGRRTRGPHRCYMYISCLVLYTSARFSY
jgi:hypothetical protein